VVTTTNLYHYNDGTDTFDSMISGLLGTAALVPRAASFQGKLLVFNGGNKVIQSDGTVGGTSIIATSPVLTAGIVFGGRVVGIAPPNTVTWSNSGDSTNWATGSAGTQPLDNDLDTVQGITRFRSQAAIVRLNSLMAASVLDASPYYDFEYLGEGIGSGAGATLIETPTQVMFIGPDNVYGAAGGAPQPIGGPRMQKFIQALNPTMLSRSMAAINPREGHIYFAVPFSANTDVTDVVVYHYPEDHFEYWTKANLTGVSVTQKTRGITWSQLTSPWSSYTQPWSELSGSTGVPTTLFLKGDGVVYKQGEVGQDNGGNGPVAYLAVYRTPMFNPLTGQVQPGQVVPSTYTIPSPVVIEMLEILSEPVAATVSVRVGWSYGTSAVTWTPFRSASLASGRILLGFATREAPLWQIELNHGAIQEIPRIRRITAWYRARRRSVA